MKMASILGFFYKINTEKNFEAVFAHDPFLDFYQWKMASILNVFYKINTEKNFEAVFAHDPEAPSSTELLELLHELSTVVTKRCVCFAALVASSCAQIALLQYDEFQDHCQFLWHRRDKK